MKLFQPVKETIKSHNADIYALYELAYTSVDFMAASLFVVGSILMFNPLTADSATLMYLVGSICFGLKPTIRVMRQLWLWRQDREEELAESAAHKLGIDPPPMGDD